MGRTGKVWGYQNLDVEPDVITSAKVRKGAMPMLRASTFLEATLLRISVGYYLQL